MKINLRHTEKITAAIEKSQRKAVMRLLDVGDLASSADNAEQLMDELGIPLAERKGCRVLVSGGFVRPSYKWVANATWATIARGGKDWFLVEVDRRNAERTSSSLAGDDYVLLPVTNTRIGECSLRAKSRVSAKVEASDER
jgi:hypothetical protein